MLTDIALLISQQNYSLLLIKNYSLLSICYSFTITAQLNSIFVETTELLHT